MNLPEPRNIVRADPALRQTYAAARATLSVAAALAISYLIVRNSGQSPVLVMVAVTVALQMSLRPTAEAPVQLRTELLGWLVAAFALTVGTLLQGSRAGSAAAFVAMMAAGTWLSGYGPFGVTLGIVGFTSYLFTQFAEPSLHNLVWLIAAATAGSVSASVVRHLVLPDRPRRMLRLLLAALRAEAEAMIRSANSPTPARSTGAHRGTAETVDAILLHLHDLLDTHPGLVSDERQFRRDTFAVVTLTHLLILQAERATEPDDAALLPPSAAPAARLEVYLTALERAAKGIPARGEGEREEALAGEQLLEDVADPQPGEGVEPLSEEGRWLTGHRQRAVQVAIAGVLAIIVGMQLSPERWYWAPMTSFFVFANVSSRGATVRKAIERTVGTVGGIAGGLLLGSALAGHTRLQLIAVFPLLFIGFWLLPISYALMTVVITALLALLYSMLAILTLDLLLLRLGETVIGAAIGALVAYLLFPTRTRDAVDEALHGFLNALDDLLAALPAATARTPATEVVVMRSVRQLDEASGTLIDTINPVTESVPGRRARALRQELILALTARYWAHRISARVLFQQPTPQDFTDFDASVARVRHRLGNLVHGGKPLAPPRRPSRARNPLKAALLRLEAVLASLARVRAGEDGTGGHRDPVIAARSRAPRPND